MYSLRPAVVKILESKTCKPISFNSFAARPILNKSFKITSFAKITRYESVIIENLRTEYF